ncbi:MAG: hypothetical protein ACI97A_000871 [Planctomycetota bacterium]|jgi:hypothetical protein
MESQQRPNRELYWFFDRLLGFVAIAVGLALFFAGVKSGESFLVSTLLGTAAAVLVYVAAVCSFVMWAIAVGVLWSKRRLLWGAVDRQKPSTKSSAQVG